MATVAIKLGSSIVADEQGEVPAPRVRRAGRTAPRLALDDAQSVRRGAGRPVYRPRMRDASDDRFHRSPVAELTSANATK
jgi:hypothetical protein